MKLSKLTLVFTLTLCAAGCMKENFSDCIYGDNAILRFSFIDSNGQDQFGAYIHTADLILFDDQGRFMMHEALSEQMLDDFRGVKLTVDPGTYYAVCWGNVRDNSHFSDFVPGVTPFSDCFLEIAPSATETGDPVYYAPHKSKPAVRSGAAAGSPTRSPGTDYDLYRIDVPEGEVVTKELRFVRAHRTVHVYAKNLASAPKVSTRQLWNRYNFFFQPQTSCCDFTQATTAEQISGGDFYVARFHSALGKFDSNMSVEIHNNMGDRTLHTVNLLQFVTDNPPADTDDIHIQVEFLDDLGIAVTVPSWVSRPVGPGVH